MKYIALLFIMLLLLFSGYSIGQYWNKKNNDKITIENYAFVREIAELASLEVNGISQFKCTNVATDDNSFLATIKNKLLENTVQISIPYTAKFGVSLQDSTAKIIPSDSAIVLILPEPQLLSYELKLDKMETADKKGWLRLQQDGTYTEFEKKMYKEGRNEIANNVIYLQNSEKKITAILQKYYASLGKKLKIEYKMPTQNKVNTPSLD